MSRVQLALNVSDLGRAVEFYSKLFRSGPEKLRPGYANFAVADPPLKLVLIEGSGQPGSLNHLGVEVDSTEEVAAATTRLAAEGMATANEDQVACCFALQDKVWVDGPDGEPWEIYTVLADVEQFAGEADPTCCGSAPESAARCCPAEAAEPVREGCTLDAAEVPARVEAWQQALAEASSRQPIGGGVRVHLPRNTELARLVSLVDAEQRCCRSLGFTLQVGADDVVLDITGPDESAPIIHTLVGLPA